jgi:hypothetical protein
VGKFLLVERGVIILFGVQMCDRSVEFYERQVILLIEFNPDSFLLSIVWLYRRFE